MAAKHCNSTRREFVSGIGAAGAGVAVAGVVPAMAATDAGLLARATAHMEDFRRWSEEDERVQSMEMDARRSVSVPKSLCPEVKRMTESGDWVRENARPMLEEEINAHADRMCNVDGKAKWNAWRKRRLADRAKYTAEMDRAEAEAAGSDRAALDAWSARRAAEERAILTTPAKSPADVLAKVLIFTEWLDGYGHLIDGEYRENECGKPSLDQVAVLEIIRDLRRLGGADVPAVYREQADSYAAYVS